MVRIERLAQLTQRQASRRSFLTGSAKLAGGGAVALLAAGAPLSVFAEENEPDWGRRGNRGRRDADCDVLNYALTLEHLEANFYIQAVEAFTEEDMEKYIWSMEFGSAVAFEVYERVVNVRNHEVTHVETLIDVLESLGCEPVPPCVYDFSAALADLPTFFATAQVLEDTGVKAYDGAIDLIESRSLQTAAATIATVEARHASYFRLLNQLNPFPAAFDEAVDPAAIIEAVLATGFIVSCPVAPPVPDQPNRCTP